MSIEVFNQKNELFKVYNNVYVVDFDNTNDFGIYDNDSHKLLINLSFEKFYYYVKTDSKKDQKIDITLKEIKQDAVTQLVNLVNKKLEYYDKHNIKLSAFYLSSMMKEALHELGYED